MAMTMRATSTAVQRVNEIPKLTHEEAGRLAQTEFERMLALLESLAGDDWEQPTYCTEWNVRQLAGHLSGAMTGSATFAEWRRMYVLNPYLKQFELTEDGVNYLQVVERADKRPAELVAEFRQNGPIALKNRQKLPWLVRMIPLPMGSLGIAPFGYLVDTIYPRDHWIHRLDICAATGKQMVVTATHDGRLIALIVRELGRKVKRGLAGRTVALRLSGEAGGDYLFGRSPTPDCTLEMGVFDFGLRTSGRITAAETAARTTITGDRETADWFLQHMDVPY